MQIRPLICLVIVLIEVLTAVSGLAGDLPILKLELSTGNKFRGKLDAKTSADRLWLRFGDDTTFVRRGFDWRDVTAVREGERSLTPQDLIQRSDLARQPATAVPEQSIVIRPSEVGPNSTTANPSTPVPPVRIASVEFNAILGNWDGDVATDGLLVQIIPIDNHGIPAAARGTLTVELFATHRIDQDSSAHGRGSDIRLVGRWSTRVETNPTVPNDNWIRLPFQSAHPELDVDWSPVGLVHLQFVVPGQGVFHGSTDGIRIRPWAPFRDMLERKTGERFLPSEFR